MLAQSREGIGARVTQVNLAMIDDHVLLTQDADAASDVVIGLESAEQDALTECEARALR